nr:intradiol ring-cleavage dioxygenase [Desulfuromonadales bacterium]
MSGHLLTRRRILSSGIAAAGGSLVLTPQTWAAGDLLRTPPQTAGPFYPSELPLDSDNDLVRVASQGQQAAGQVIHLFGRVYDVSGLPLSGAQVEIWQCDAKGFYHHPRDRGGQADPNFQGFGRTSTDDEGGYRFRTIMPVPYPGRTPHIHVQVKSADGKRLVTQMYIKDHPLNAEDFLYTRIRKELRPLVEVAFAPAEDLEPGSAAGTFDLVL